MASIYFDSPYAVKTGVIQARVLALAVLMRAAFNEVKEAADRLQNGAICGFTWTAGTYLYNGYRMADGAIQSFEVIARAVQHATMGSSYAGLSACVCQDRVIAWLVDVETQRRHLEETARSMPASTYEAEVGALISLELLVWRTITDLAMPEPVLDQLRQLGAPYTTDACAPTAGLWPGVAAVKADADLYCLACARNLYGTAATLAAVDGGTALYSDREGNDIAPVLCSEEIEGGACCGNCGLKLDVVTI